MATIKPTVLITGATGHLGHYTLILTLQAGYRARVAIRNAKKAEKLKSLPAITPFLDDVSFINVPDITTDGAYSEAIRDVDHVLHIASPIPDASMLSAGSEGHPPNWQTLLYDPAKRGTLNMLVAASQTPSVKTVVITSSVVILSPTLTSALPGPSPSDILPLPDSSALAAAEDPEQAYTLAKLLAHHAATQFMQTTSPRPLFKLIRILPAYIQGPNALVSTAEEFFSGSNEGSINAALGNVSANPKVTCLVALEDVARAHVVCLGGGGGGGGGGGQNSRKSQVEDGDVLSVVGNGGRYTSWDVVGDWIRKAFPKAVEKGVLTPVGQQRQKDKVVNFDTRGSEEKLGFEFDGLERAVRQAVGAWLEWHGHAKE